MLSSCGMIEHHIVSRTRRIGVLPDILQTCISADSRCAESPGLYPHDESPKAACRESATGTEYDDG